MKRNILTLAINAVGLTAAVSIVVAAGIHFQHTKDQIPPPRIYTTPQPSLMSYLGVYEPTSPHSYSGVERFSQLVGRPPNIVVYYSGWWEPFRLAFAQAAEAHHALPMVQIEPENINLASIASGQYDSYLHAYARAVRSFGHSVILAFGHEMNADWYTWGYRHTRPVVFVSAWQHVTKLFAAEKANNVRWLWAVNVVGGPHVSAIEPWWPGAAYITWVGVDGHYYQPGKGFSQLFGATLSRVRKFTSHPVLLAETGIAPSVGIAKITDLFAGAQARGLLGVVWFEQGQNLRVENDPAAITIFRRAVSRYVAPVTSKGS